MRLTDHFKKAVGLWPPRAAYRTLRSAISRSGDAALLPPLLRSYPDAVRWEKKGDMQPLDFALWQGNYAAARILIEHEPALLSDKNSRGRTLLQEAAAGGNTKSLKFLIQQGADLHMTDAAGRTALHCALAARFASDAYVLLLHYGAAHALRDAEGRTPLMIALMSGHKPAAETLMKKSYDPQQVDKYERTLLMAAAESGLDHLVEPLLQAGCPLFATNALDETALDLAIRHKRGPAALKLLEAGTPAQIDDKKRKKLGNLIRPLEGSTPALKSIGLRPSPKPKSKPAGPKPY